MTDEPRRHRWRARIIVVAVVAVVLGATTSVVVLTRAGDAGSAPVAAQPPVATAEIVRTDLTEEEAVDGTLGYGQETAITGRQEGTLTWLPSAGATITHGQQVYGVDAKPVPLFYGTLPFYRDLAEGVDDGPDVKVLEENLAVLGFGGFGTPNTKFTVATASAVKKWQKALGLTETGTFGQGAVVLAPGPIRISEIIGQLGGAAGGEVLKSTGTTRSIEVRLDTAKQHLATPNAKVSVTVNGTTTTGTVTSVGQVAEEAKDASGQPTGKLEINVTIAIDDPAAAGTLDNAPASVRFTKDTRKGVLTVPVGALVALAEGGYAVEVDRKGRRTLVPVETGLFSNGKVEISGDGLGDGTRVVTTS